MVQVHGTQTAYSCGAVSYCIPRGQAPHRNPMFLAVHCLLHKIRSATPTPRRATFMDPICAVLPEPQDQVEEGERINGFWTVYCLQRKKLHSAVIPWRRAVLFGPKII